MNNYSQALEDKYEIIKTWESPKGRDWMRQYFDYESESLIQEIRESYPFFVESDICKLISEASGSLPRSTLSEELFITKSGWVTLDTPILLKVPLPKRDEDPIYLKYFAWYVFEKSSGEDFDYYFSFYEFRFGKIYPFLFLGGKFDEEFAGMDIFNYSVIGDKPETVNINNQQDIDEANLAKRILKSWIISFFLFVNQKLLVRSKQIANRTTRRRLNLNPDLSEIDVILLRTHIYKPTGGGADVEWSCKWLVRGHWRQQPYKNGIYRPIWIAPYWKGPDDKPVKNPNKIFDVTR